MKPKKEEYLFYRGGKFGVEFYFTGSGAMPAKEYFDLAPSEVRVKLAALVKYMAEEGRIFDKTKFRVVDRNDKIYEFKPVGHRFFSFFYEGGKIILTNAYVKKSQEVSYRDIERAKNYKKDYMRRVKGGDYYEKD